MADNKTEAELFEEHSGINQVFISWMWMRLTTNNGIGIDHANLWKKWAVRQRDDKLNAIRKNTKLVLQPVRWYKKYLGE